jgi:hypothetical protein
MKDAEGVEERAMRLSGMVNIIRMEALFLLPELAEDKGREVFICDRAAACTEAIEVFDWPTAKARVVPLAAKATTRHARPKGPAKIRAMIM